MLACAPGGPSTPWFSASLCELAVRIDDAQPKALLTASCGLEADRVIPYAPLVTEALVLAATPPAHCVVVQRPQAPMAHRGPDDPARPRGARGRRALGRPIPHPLHLRHDGKPKGVVRDHGGHAVALAASMARVYDTAREVFWAASTWGGSWATPVAMPPFGGRHHDPLRGQARTHPDAGAFGGSLRSTG